VSKELKRYLIGIESDHYKNGVVVDGTDFSVSEATRTLTVTRGEEVVFVSPGTSWLFIEVGDGPQAFRRKSVSFAESQKKAMQEGTRG
jgi:hypothetical protein